MISFVSQASAAATSVAIPTHQVGDMLIVIARGTAAAPVKPAASGTVPAWISIQAAVANSIGLTSVGFVATATNHTTGVFTSATHIGVLVLRSNPLTHTLAVGTSSTGNGNNVTNIIYPALTLTTTDGSSFGVRGAARPLAATAVGTAPTSWTNRVVQPATPSLAIHSRDALVANPIADTVAIGTSSAYRAHTIEVRETLIPLTKMAAVI